MTVTTNKKVTKHKTKALINKTTTLHVHYSWYISLPFCVQIQREATKSKFCVEGEHTAVNFRFSDNLIFASSGLAPCKERALIGHTTIF